MSNKKIEGGFDLYGWNLPKLENKLGKASAKAQKKIEEAVEELLNNFYYGESLQRTILDAASEALNYAAKNQFEVSFLSTSRINKTTPGEIRIEICFSDYDVITFKEPLIKNIKDSIKWNKDEDGYTTEDMEEEFKLVAEEFRKCADLLDKSIRPLSKK